MKRLPLQALAAVLAACAVWIALGSLIVAGARRHDFLNLYSGASLALEGRFAQLHEAPVQLERERRFVPDLDALVPFVRPAFYAALLAPLALIPFGPAFWCWLALQTVVLLICWRWAYRRWGADALIFGAFYLPTTLGIAHGQDCVLLLAIVIAAFVLSGKDRPASAGAVLALGLIKFHLFLLWPLAMVITARWAMLAGWAVVGGFEAAVSWALTGTPGVRHYISLLTDPAIQHLNPSPELTISVHGLAANIGGSSAWVAGALAVVVVALTAAAVWKAPLWRWFAAASVGSLLVVPHVYGYDAGLLLLGVWATIFCGTTKPPRVLAATLATPVPFFIALAGRPWASVTPVLLLLFLASLSAETFRKV